ncbi:hypothetical protein DFJ73DRAFT_823899 [Zopfochytrium polystomum]|nr:hypothetical protein DFJ73DRAFT_823899 [Zopfochytrium polystomum]
MPPAQAPALRRSLVDFPIEILHLIVEHLSRSQPHAIHNFLNVCKTFQSAVESASAAAWKRFCEARWHGGPANLPRALESSVQFWRTADRSFMHWLRGTVSFHHHEEQTDLMLGATCIAVSSSLIISGAEDTHALGAPSVTDCLIVRGSSSMAVMGVIKGHNPYIITFCGETLVAAVQKTSKQSGTSHQIRLLCLPAGTISQITNYPGQPAPGSPRGRSTPSSLSGSAVVDSSTETFSTTTISSTRSSLGSSRFRWRRKSTVTRRSLTQKFLRMWERTLNNHFNDFSFSPPVVHKRTRRSSSEFELPPIWNPSQDESSDGPFRDSLLTPTLELGSELVVGACYHSETNTLLTGSRTGALKVWSLVTYECLYEARDRDITSVALCGGVALTGGGTIDDQFLHCFEYPSLSFISGCNISYNSVCEAATILNLPKPRESHLWSVDTMAISETRVAVNFGYHDIFLVLHYPKSRQGTENHESICSGSWTLKFVLDGMADSTGEETWGEWFHSPKICMHGRFLFTTSLQRHLINMWDLSTGRVLRRLARDPENGLVRKLDVGTSVTSIQISPDGTKLLVSVFGGAIYEWRTEKCHSSEF